MPPDQLTEVLTPEARLRRMSTLLPVGPEEFAPNLPTETLPEMSSCLGPALDEPTETWNVVKDSPSDSGLNQERGAVGAFGVYGFYFCVVS
jgi:hypothetical protein